MPKKGQVIKIVERKTTELHIACQKGETARLAILLENGAPVDVLDRDDASPLHHACYNGQLKCVKKLLKFNANVELKDSEGSTPLHNAAFQGYDEIMDLLLKKNAQVDPLDNQGGTPLLNAACNGHEEALKLLIKKGASANVRDTNGATPLHYAAYNGHDAVIRVLLASQCDPNVTDNDNVTPLHHACGNGHFRAARLLVDAGANINAEDDQGTTPLHAAAFNNHVTVIEILLQHASQHYGADLRMMLLSRQDKEGSTPMHKAAYNGDVEVMKLFLESGVDLNAVDKEGSTPLHKASFKGNSAILQLLLAKDANLNIRDNQGGTALYNACYNGHTMCVQMLLGHSRSDEMINLKDNNGRTPLHAAACFGHWECLHLLLSHKADPDVQDDEGLTPLHLACFNGNYLSISFLMVANCNFKLKTKDGINALHYAAYNGHLTAIHLLLEKEAPINCMDDRNVTPLHYAAACNHWEVIRYLIFKGAETDFMNKEGLTPLAYAAKNGALDAATILLENGADLDMKNDKGVTPRKLVKVNRNNPCRQLFESLGRKPYPPETLAMLSDVRVKLNRRRKKTDGDKVGVQGGLDSLPGLGAVSRLSSPFSEHGFDYDLNDVAEIADKIFVGAKKLKEHWTFLNIMRHFLLIPNDEVNGRKMWALVEMFCNQVILTDSTETTKMKFAEFLPMYNAKDKFTKVRKLDMLVGVENALPILFPQMPQQDEFGEVTWRPTDLLGEGRGENEEDEEEEEEEDGDAPVKAKKGKKKKKKADDDEEEEGEEEEEEEDEGKPKRVVKKKQWETSKDKDEASDAVNLKDNEIGVVAKVQGHSVRKDYAGDDQDEWEKMMKASKDGPKPMMAMGGGPPPPPPPPGGGPPPPPGGPGGPPPPPGGLIKAQPAPLPPGRKELKDIKLRKLPWKKLPLAKINNTIWNMFKDNNVEIDVPLIIEYFQERKEEKKEEKKLRKERKQVLDLKRANHIGLMLAMVKGRTYKQVRQAVIDLDESLLSEDLLRAFVKLTPQKTDIELLAPYKSYTEEQRLELGDADQFFLEIMDIPRLESRLQAFLFKKTFEVQYAELKEMVTAASEAIKNVSTNFKLAKLLEIILNIGNFLNYDTYAGNAFGFSLDGLAKLRDTKSTVSPDYTILHYLAQYITENRDKLLGFVDDLENIGKGNNDFVNAINSAQAELKAGMATLLGELEARSANPDPEDPFQAKMESFAQKAKEDLKILLDDIAELNKAQKQMTVWFAAEKDVDIIDVLMKFRSQFADAIEENKKREEAQAKQAKKKKRVVIKKKSTKTRTNRKMPTGNRAGMGKVDDAGFDVAEGADSGAGTPVAPSSGGVVRRRVVKKKVIRRKKAPGGAAGGAGGEKGEAEEV